MSQAGVLRTVRDSDADLLAAVAGGDLTKLGALFDRHHAGVRAFVERVAVGGDVDDIVQETFLTAARAAASFDGRESARPFLLGIAARVLRHKKRSFARLRGMLERFGALPNTPVRTPEDDLSSKDDARRLRAALARLSEDRRIAILLVEVEGFSGVEVAEALGVPVGTVWRRLHEARAKLRDELGRQRP